MSLMHPINLDLLCALQSIYRDPQTFCGNGLMFSKDNLGFNKKKFYSLNEHQLLIMRYFQILGKLWQLLI